MGNCSGWETGSKRVKTCEPGTCVECGARLSVYRPGGEQRCAPCLAGIAAAQRATLKPIAKSPAATA